MDVLQVGDLVTWTAEYNGLRDQVTFIVVSMKDSEYHWADIIIEALTTDGEFITLNLPDPTVEVVSRIQ